MSTVKRDELVGAIGAGIQRWQDATEAFDETVGRIHGLNSAERRCLSFVSQGPQAASAIAKETKLTPAAITSLIDRLESRGLARRRADTVDRRRVLVEATERTRDLVRSVYGPIARAGAELLGGYSLAELATIRRFVDDTLVLQARMTEALLQRTRKRGRARD